MAKAPFIQESLQWSGQEHAYGSISVNTKSRFKSFFQWHKTTGDTARPSTWAEDSLRDQALRKAENNRRPSPSPRTFSDNITGARSKRLHGSDGARSRNREKVLIDPPPLAQAYRQALIHANLATPESFSELVRSRRNSLSAQDASGRIALEDTVQVKCTHKKTDSGSETCMTKSKNFMLIHGPYLLQFPSEAEPNTLPEKILILDKNCVAFGCDTVPGHPWVLQVSKTNPSMASTHEKTLRPSWSRLTLRQPEDKRTVSTTLIVFDNSEELYTWLFAIRKEIEHLGGLEYRPDTAHDDQTWRENLTRKFDPVTQDRTNRSERSSLDRTLAPHKPLALKTPNASEAGPVRRPQSHKSATSSKHTATSLDGLRDSLTSNGYSSTLATSSGTGSVPSTSPTTECFPSTGKIADTVKQDLSLRSFSSTSESLNQRSKSQPGRSSILERRKLSVNPLTLMQPDSTKAWKVLASLPSIISASPNDSSPRLETLPSVLQPLVPENLSSSILDERTTKIADQPLYRVSLSQQQEEIPSRRPSHGGTFTTSAKPKYTLFPVRSVPENKHEPLASPTILVRPTSRSKSRTRSRQTQDEDYKIVQKHRKNRSRTVTLELRQHRKSALLGLGQSDVPLRSPAVTDDMIMSNFGVKTKTVPLSPMPNSTVPGLAELNFGLEFLKMPYQSQASKNTIESRRASSAKSISSVHSGVLSAFAKIPAGPPPAGPLPAVPTESQSDSRACRVSQHSQNSHSSRHSGRRSTQRSTNGPVASSSSSNPPNNINDSPISHQHTQTTSSTLDSCRVHEPPPPAYVSRKPFEDSERRTRSRSRGRRKSTSQRC